MEYEPDYCLSDHLAHILCLTFQLHLVLLPNRNPSNFRFLCFDHLRRFWHVNSMLHHASKHIPDGQEPVCAAADKEKHGAVQRQNVSSMADTCFRSDQEMVVLGRLRP